MQVELRQRRGVCVVGCTGELTLGGGEAALARACRAAIDDGQRRLVLDLSGVVALDSAGIGAIVQCEKAAAAQGVVLKLALGSAAQPRRALALTHLDRVFDVFDDADAAVAAFGA